MLDMFLAVFGGFKNRVFKLNSHIPCCPMFQVVFPGYCQTTLKEGCDDRDGHDRNIRSFSKGVFARYPHTRPNPTSGVAARGSSSPSRALSSMASPWETSGGREAS